MSKYHAVNWSPNEQIGEVRMDTMTDNMKWLFENTPRAIYTLPPSLRRVEGVRMACGRAIIPAQASDTATVEVRFGNFFSANTEPNVVTSLISPGQNRFFHVIHGIGRTIPDHRGFRIKVNVDAKKKENDKIKKTIYVSWQAMGI